MATLPDYVIAVRVVAVDAHQVTVETTVDRRALYEAALAEYYPALAGTPVTELICSACGAHVYVAGPAAPVRWICACGQEQACAPPRAVTPDRGKGDY